MCVCMCVCVCMHVCVCVCVPHLVDGSSVWHEVVDIKRAQFEPMFSGVVTERHSVVAEVGETDVSNLQLSVVLCQPPVGVVHPYLNTTYRFSRLYKGEGGELYTTLGVMIMQYIIYS